MLSPDLHLLQLWNEGSWTCCDLVVGSNVLRASRADGTQRAGSSKGQGADAKVGSDKVRREAMGQGRSTEQGSRDLSPLHLDLTMRPLASHLFLWISTPLSLRSGIGDH